MTEHSKFELSDESRNSARRMLFEALEELDPEHTLAETCPTCTGYRASICEQSDHDPDCWVLRVRAMKAVEP